MKHVRPLVAAGLLGAGEAETVDPLDEFQQQVTFLRNVSAASVEQEYIHY